MMTIKIQELGYRKLHRLRNRYLAVAIPARIGNDWDDVTVVDMICTHKNGVQSIIITPVHAVDPTQPQDEKPARQTFAQKKKVRDQARKNAP